jgi:hypothetical protein
MGTGMGQAFNDESNPPTPASIAAALGDAAPVWRQTVAMFEAAGVTVEWRYYRDGGWLAKATRRSQTIAWMRVEPGHLRVTFYFAARFRELLLADSVLDATLREQIANSTAHTITLSPEMTDLPVNPRQLLVLIALKNRAK